MRRLIVFDFDWSMADQDSDRWIFEVLAPDLRRKMKTLKDDIQWTDLVSQSLREAHARGITREQIEDALRIMPFHPGMVRGIKRLKEEGNTTFLCLSNANNIFITTILEKNGLLPAFEEIITNRAEWEPSGLLNLRRRIDPHGPQHNCMVGCSPNMCKGEELDAFLARHAPAYDQIIYVGDGSNDFCPTLRLRSQDMVLCRSFRGLQRRIAKEGEKLGLKCQVKYWGGAWEVEEIFNALT
ncbi:phosphatase phospho-type [Desarmillaria tabescens]|uniref:Phosphatase phospho-type n=1 Tax=Armillaria tabescens TaxID=1929756 RepID=A0AA39N919_ARMTA|nr:phosphatase phospho-type [Desarmillaria tabescens]KAK0461258.1 phosphatase phospho-type [Desarmillaria tabescens]